jgi:hypothetical protein
MAVRPRDRAPYGAVGRLELTERRVGVPSNVTIAATIGRS